MDCEGDTFADRVRGEIAGQVGEDEVRFAEGVVGVGRLARGTGEGVVGHIGCVGGDWGTLKGGGGVGEGGIDGISDWMVCGNMIEGVQKVNK